MLPVYRDKDTIIHALHPLAAILLLASLLAAVLLLENPLYLAVAGAGLAALVFLAEVSREVRPFLRLGLFLAFLVLIVNPLVNHRGDHVLVYGPRLPVLGRLDVTLEALVYGAVSGFRLMLVVLAFGLAGTALNPDHLLEVLSRISFRSSLSAALAVRLYPSLVLEAREMRDVQAVRGERLHGGGRWERARAQFPFWLALFQGSLDRAANIAESMTARGFGNGKVTRIRRAFRPRDAIFSFLALGTMAVAVISSIGKSDYRYFPALSNPLRGTMIWVPAVMAGSFSILVIVGRCWKRWPWWRSRI